MSQRRAPALRRMGWATLALLWAASCLLTVAHPATASSVTFVASTPIGGDSVPVTVTVADAPEGDAVDVSVSIAPGTGDLLGLFGNALPESLVSELTLVDATGVVTQWQAGSNQVWKVGGGNVMSPVKTWDWGVRFGQAGSGGGAIHAASFRLTAPGLTAASLADAATQGWRLGVRIQGTSGPEGSAKIGVAASQPPQGQAPTVAIAAPSEGAFVATSEVAVAGSFTGTPPVAVAVNGTAATLAGAGFSALLSLPDGPHTLTATATNASGSASDAVAITVDTAPPLVTIATPPPGTQTTADSTTVTGTVADVSPIVGVTVNGVAATLDGAAFTAEIPLALGENQLTATATDAAGHTGTASVTVTRGTPPAIAITTPSEGGLLGTSTVTVTGSVSGSDPIGVDVGGVATTVTAGSFTASLDLPDGSHTVTATATSPFGTATDVVTFEIDTSPPVVTITSPANGATLAEQPISLTGTVADASPIVGLRIDGDPIFVASPFSTTAALVEGPNTITVDATDAAGNVGSAQVSVTYQPSLALSIAIETPPEGALLSRDTVEVAGTVSDPTAAVAVNGVLATVTGQRWVAAAVSLEEGSNNLTATATRGTMAASDAVSVLCNAPPRVVITGPASGDLFRTEQTDVEGVVDDLTAFVDVNGNHASVGAGGRFLAPSVPLALGDNTLVARAIDALGAKGTDEVAVVRNDGAETRAHLAVLDGDFAFATLADWDATLPLRNERRFFPWPAPASRDRLVPRPDAAVVFPQIELFVFSETAEPTAFEAFLEGESTPFAGPVTLPALPIDELSDNLYLPGVANPSAFFPASFEPGFYVQHQLLVPCIPDSCPDDSIADERIRIRATTAGRQKEILLHTDVSRPMVTITSPEEGSVLGGDTVTVTGTVTDAHALLDTLAWEIEDEFGIVVDEGTAPLLFDDAPPSDPQRAQARFALSDLVVGPGWNTVRVRVWDAEGNFRTQATFFQVDPDAPAVALVWPRDGSAQVEEPARITLNFAATTTLVAVNGVPDGRSFGPGLAESVLTPSLAIGPNRFVLELESVGVAFTFSFTLHRVEALGGVRIVSPAAGAFVNQEALTVAGTAPLGTPAVEVNGVLATLAPDGVSFSAEIPIPRSPGVVLEGGELGTKPHPITAVALPLGATAAIEVTPDFGEPLFRAIVPADGSVTNEEDVAVTGYVSEPATVSLSGPAGTVSSGAIRDLARERIERIENPRPFSFGGEQFHRFELSRLAIEPGADQLTLTAVDRAGNETALAFHVTRRESVLSLVSPAAGTAVSALVTDVTLAAAAAVTIDAWFVGGRLVPALGGASVPAGSFIVPSVPLGPGANEMRVVYRQAGGGPEVVRFVVDSAATNAALVSGQVTNGLVGTPIAGALVSITAGGVTIVAVTDANGRYAVPVAPGPVTVVAAAEHYASVTVTGAVDPGATFTADPVLSPSGVPALANELRILVPPDGAVTDWEQVTVVGTVLNSASQVAVNGIAAEVVGNRFTARHVPLGPGPNGIQASAMALGVPNAVDAVSVERSDTPVLDVELFSPPDGATIPGGGLVVRGWVSAKDAVTWAADRFVPLAEGLFEATEVDVDAGAFEITVVARLPDDPAEVLDTVRVTSTSAARVLTLDVEPASATVPFEATASLRTDSRASFRRLDFDLDGDRELEVVASPAPRATASYEDARPYEPRVYATLPSGVELSAAATVHGYLAPTILRTLAAGNPVDLAIGLEGDLYVLDAAAGQVTRYDDAGSAIGHFGASGSGPGQLSSPQAFALAADGRVFVADTGNDRIQVFAPDGAWERSFGSTGAGSGQLRQPSGIAVEDERFVVAERGNARIQIFDLEGHPILLLPGNDARGLAAISGRGTVAALPAAGLRFVLERTLVSNPSVDELYLRATLGAPIDVALADSGIWLADSAEPRLVGLSDDLGFVREVRGLARPVRAVARGHRRDVESVFVADGFTVTEIGLPVPSPVPVVAALKDRLIAGDVEGALDLFHPQQRALFRRIYEDRGPGLASDAAAMHDFAIDLLRESRAIVRIRHTLEIGGSMVERFAPVHLVRAEDGTWQIFDY